MAGTWRSWSALLGGSGPDHFMELCVDRDVRALVRGLDTTGFVRTELTGQAMFSEVRGPLACEGFDLFANTRSAERLLDNLRGARSENEWSYQTIMVGCQRVWIEHGCGASSPDTLAAEMRVIQAVVSAVSLVSWSIEFGGQGHSHGVARAGTSAAELAAVLEQIT